MSKKKRKLPFAIGGIVGPSCSDVVNVGEMVLTKDERERLAKVLNPVSVADAKIPAENLMRVAIENQRGDFPIFSIDPQALKKKPEPSVMDIIEQHRIEHRKTRLEDNHPVMEFLEDIIYCPSQIEFYFRDGDAVHCLYIRQRHGETTAQLVPCYGSGDMDYDAMWPHIELSRDYDIEGKSYVSEEAEEHEIIEIEKECLAKLRTMFPDTPFPEHPNRRRGHGYTRLPDVLLK